MFQDRNPGGAGRLQSVLLAIIRKLSARLFLRTGALRLVVGPDAAATLMAGLLGLRLLVLLGHVDGRCSRHRPVASGPGRNLERRVLSYRTQARLGVGFGRSSDLAPISTAHHHEAVRLAYVVRDWGIACPQLRSFGHERDKDFTPCSGQPRRWGKRLAFGDRFNDPVVKVEGEA